MSGKNPQHKKNKKRNRNLTHHGAKHMSVKTDLRYKTLKKKKTQQASLEK